MPPAEAEAEVAPVAPVTLVALNGDGDELDFGVHLTGRGNDGNNEDEIYNEDEGDVAFGSPDLYDVKELIELCLKILALR